ncbi:MAG TPA: hypothetical protein VJH92_02175 [Candidatus Nanoarchaeia archaeon]|nr:hypothetical protein [Candidatus Nanoarchaeia archaeon]
MNFIKKIFDAKSDDLVHLQFQKFSRGEFKNRAVVKVKCSPAKYTIATSAEFANEFVRELAEVLGENKTRITGVVVSTADLTGQMKFKSKKQFQGVKQYVIDDEMSGDEILSLLNKFQKAFFALSFSVGGDTLKIKAKAPKSGKPGGKGEERPNPDFCRLSTKDKKIVDNFVFERSAFKEAIITHTFVIEDIVIPDSLKKSDDFAKIREESRRKGKIIRETEIDGQKIETEKPFEA